MWSSFASTTNLSSNNIQSIAIDENGVWFATDNGVSTYSFYSAFNNPSVWKKYTITDGLAINNIYGIAIDGGDVWFGTWGNGICKYNRSSGTWTYAVCGSPTPTTYMGNYISTIAVDSENVWFGTRSGGATTSGVRRYIKSTCEWINYTRNDCNILQNGVTSISPDGDSVWIGTSDKVAKFSLTDTSWTTYGTSSSGLVNNNVRAVVVDGDFVWFGTANGVSKYNKSANQWTTYSTMDGLISNDVYAIAIEGNDVWFGTTSGVSKYSINKNTWINYTTADGLVSNAIKSIITKGDGILWFGTSNGVTRHDCGKPFTASDNVYFNDVNNNAFWDNGEDIWYDVDNDGVIIPERLFKITVLPYINKLPTVTKTDFTSGSAYLKTNHAINFTGVAKDDDGSIATYVWEFGDGSNWSSSTIGNTTHVYLESGIYPPVFKVKDNDGGETQKALPNITVVNNVVPSVDIELPSAITARTLLQFYSNANDGDGEIVSYLWEFGDGNTSVVQDPTYTYIKRGTFMINLTVTDDDGATNCISKTISIINQKPIVNISLPPYISIGVLLEYGCTANDSDGEIVSYLWDFGDGAANSTLQNASHAYLKNGEFSITLTVTDNDNENTIIIRNVTLGNMAPMPIITEPVKRSFNTLETIIFNASNSTDVDGDLPLIYSWQFDDSFDPSNSTATTPIATHSYKKAGTYNVTLTITDNKSASNSTKININTTNRLPKPFITVDNIQMGNKAFVNTPLHFNASTSRDDDGDITGYQWEIVGLVTTLWDTTPYYDYTFNTVKTYTVVLRVRDDNNGTDDTRIIISIEPNKPIPSINYDNSVEYKPGEAIIFDASASTSMGATIISYKWDFGDGKSTNWNLANKLIEHAYNHSGNYLVTLSVMDSSSNQTSNQNKTMITITIENVPPIPVFTTHRKGKVSEAMIFDASGSVDPYGTIVSYIWDFDDDTTVSYTWNKTKRVTYRAVSITHNGTVVSREVVNESGSKTTHTYADEGEYRVKLTVIDDNGTTNSTALEYALSISSRESGENKWALDDPNVIGLIVTGIGFMVAYIAYTAKKRKVGKYIKQITDVYMRQRYTPDAAENELNMLRDEFFKKFEKGKMDSDNYLILERKIDTYIKELRTKTVETKMGVIPAQIQQTIGNILADGRITKEEYENLRNMVSSTDMSEVQRKQLEEMFSVWMKSDDRFREAMEVMTPQPMPQKRLGVSKLALMTQRVRCSKCKAIINVTSAKRPLTVYCPKCGMKGVLKGKETAPTTSSTVVCPSCQTDVPEQLLIDGKCPYCGSPVNE